MEGLEDDRNGANSEMRYITLELMKLSAKRKTPFARIAAEFVGNTYRLAEMLQSVQYSKGQPSGRKKEAPGQDGKE